MLNDRERLLFEALERQFYDEEPGSIPPSRQDNRCATPPPGDDRCADAGRGSLLEAAMGVCVTLIAVSGLLGSPEAVLGFTGAFATLGFAHYHF